MLRHVLREFETTTEPISLNTLSTKLGLDRETLSLMLDYWVRQGRLQDNRSLFQTDSSNCQSKGCGSSCQSCSFLASMPRAYTLVKNKTAQE